MKINLLFSRKPDTLTTNPVIAWFRAYKTSPQCTDMTIGLLQRCATLRFSREKS